MSWNFKGAGVNKAKLIAALNAHTDIPPHERDRLSKEIDGKTIVDGQIIVVETSGHLQDPQYAASSEGDSVMKSRVSMLPFYST